MADLESGRDTHVESFPLGYTWPVIKTGARMGIVIMQETIAQVNDAAWRAKRDNQISWLDDEHGHIAAIVPEDLVKYALRHGCGR